MCHFVFQQVDEEVFLTMFSIMGEDLSTQI